MEQVVADALRRLGVLLDERRRRRAPAQRLDAERTGSGVKIEHPRAGDLFRQTRKNHLPDAILRRAQKMMLRRFQVKTAGGAGDDAQGHGGFLDRINQMNRILKAGRIFDRMTELTELKPNLRNFRQEEHEGHEDGSRRSFAQPDYQWLIRGRIA